MGKRVLAESGVAGGPSAAPTSAGATTSSSNAERTDSSEEAQLRALYRQAVAESGRHAITGEPIDVRAAHHFVVRGGLIVRFEQFVDTALVRDAMTG